MNIGILIFIILMYLFLCCEGPIWSLSDFLLRLLWPLIFLVPILFVLIPVGIIWCLFNIPEGINFCYNVLFRTEITQIVETMREGCSVNKIYSTRACFQLSEIGGGRLFAATGFSPEIIGVYDIYTIRGVKLRNIHIEGFTKELGVASYQARKFNIFIKLADRRLAIEPSGNLLEIVDK